MKNKVLLTFAVVSLLSSCGECKHIDENKDHICDLCNERLSECKDENHDHICDYCMKVISMCKDENSDCFCDICDKEMRAPEDCIKWPEEEIQDLVEEVADSETIIPHFNWADDIDINTDELASDNYFGIWCYVEEDKYESVYLKVLQKAKWTVQTDKDVDGLYCATDPHGEVLVKFKFNSSFSDLEIYVFENTNGK